MEDRLSRIEATVADIERRLRAIEHAAPVAIEEPDAPLVPIIQRDAAAEVLTMIGRTLVALGGAYLLRALSDSHTLPLPLGIALGFAYAALWLGAADRDGLYGRRTSAA